MLDISERGADVTLTMGLPAVLEPRRWSGLVVRDVLVSTDTVGRGLFTPARTFAVQQPR